MQWFIIEFKFNISYYYSDLLNDEIHMTLDVQQSVVTYLPDFFNRVRFNIKFNHYFYIPYIGISI